MQTQSSNIEDTHKIRAVTNRWHKLNNPILKIRTFLVSSGTAAERRGNTFKGFEDSCLKAKARIWPGLSYLLDVHSAARSLSYLFNIHLTDCPICSILTVLFVPYSVDSECIFTRQRVNSMFTRLPYLFHIRSTADRVCRRRQSPVNPTSGRIKPLLDDFLSIRCILGDMRLWVGDTSTSSCRV